MVLALFQVDCTEMCVGSACTQPLNYDKKYIQCFCFNLLICFSRSQIEPFNYVMLLNRAPLPQLTYG